MEIIHSQLNELLTVGLEWESHRKIIDGCLISVEHEAMLKVASNRKSSYNNMSAISKCRECVFMCNG